MSPRWTRLDTADMILPFVGQSDPWGGGRPKPPIITLIFCKSWGNTDGFRGFLCTLIYLNCHREGGGVAKKCKKVPPFFANRWVIPMGLEKKQ